MEWTKTQRAFLRIFLSMSVSINGTPDDYINKITGKPEPTMDG
jgi:hypothetical protein